MIAGDPEDRVMLPFARQTPLQAAFRLGEPDGSTVEADEVGPEESEAGERDDAGAPDKQTDNLIAYYFGDVCQFSLLDRAEEQALWRRIERYRERLAQALWTSPVALPTLASLEQQVEHGSRTLARVLRCRGMTAEQLVEARKQLETSVHRLRTLRTEIQESRRRLRTATSSTSQRRVHRQHLAGLWHRWVAVWKGLDLHPETLDAIQLALEVAFQARPGDPALRAARAARSWAGERLAEAREHMLQANLRLVIHVANRYRNRDVPLLDLIQEGNLGLMRALEKFEPRRGLKFITYAHWWVRQAVGRFLIEQGRTVRLPNHIAERRSKLTTATERLWDAYGRAPSTQELSMAVGWTPEDIAALQAAGQPIASLDTPVGKDGRELAEVLEDARTAQPEALQDEAELRHRVAACLATLTEREAYILRLRHGIESEHPHTLREIAAKLGLSRERVRQVEHQALEKLRRSRCHTILAELADV
jgi:RNA polymerase primary sigma factor